MGKSKVEFDLNKILEKYQRVDVLKEQKFTIKELVKINKGQAKEIEVLLGLKRTPVKTYNITPNFAKSQQATASMNLGDVHLEEEVKPATVNYMNKYNLDIAKKSVDNFFCNGIKLLKKEEQDIKIPHLILGLLGDLITGSIHDENMEVCLVRPIEAAMLAREWIYNGICFLLNHTKSKITVVCKGGNHSRITNKIRHATFYGNSLETMVYAWLSSQFQNEPRISFIIDEAYHTYLNVYGFTLRYHHGHALKYQGGVGGITIPINKAIAQWNKQKTADLDIFGHWHQRMYDMGSNKFVSNGSVIGHNPYAISIKASFEEPTQSFFLFDNNPKRFKTATFPIFVR